MKALSQSDQLHLSAAIGWIELNNPLYANEELELISPQERAQPEVLNVRLIIYALMKKWEGVSEIADELFERRPDSISAWLACAASLHQAGQTAEAVELLGCIASKTFEYRVSFDLARYSCRLGLVENARRWLERAFSLNTASQVKLNALDDSYLEPLWSSIEK